ncbi:hypothetical protein NliqN6_6072 [Naganishia liquefaciens]|uniref:Arginine biosynthesis bifunctional protein ArgJ, mitochondrial n=1 Tax=Naganishia liquefaciens TaxID=104408 RepID=A0A8H3TZE1_9TREE|nr:hypothetical protein NliqN6_6072 [Naganishia liquefaciens]
MVQLAQGRTLVNAAVPVISRAYASASKAAPSKEHHVLSLPDSAFPKGFQVAAAHAGVKKKEGALDLGVLVSTADTPCNAAACFTRNVFKAAPVVVSTKVLEEGNGRVRGFVVNSGCANAVTGSKGMEDAWAMSKKVTDGLAGSSGSPSTGTLVMSTGVIGQHLPIDAITSKIPSLLSSLSGSASSWMSLAKAFMTTDTFPKLRAREFKLGSQTVRIAGIDKGAGMIHPNMGPPHATLLGVVATDASISPKALQSALTYAVDRSFNSITVDGDMSTNDTILCLANGAATSSSGERAQEITEEGNPEEFAVFKEELRSFAEELAQLVVRDGEGATKFVTVRVENGPSYEVSRAVASSVATSSLVKTALYGQDANWGRILCAVGYTNLPAGTISPTSVSVSFIPPKGSPNPTPLQLLTNGEPEPNIDEARGSEILAEEDLEILIDLGVKGGEGAKYWTCDFSHEYVSINADYRS